MVLHINLSSEISLFFIENVLQIIGAFVVFSVAFVSYYGYKKTDSPTMIRLTIAFLLLGCGFSISGIGGILNLNIQTSNTFVAEIIVISAASLETAGYFFLAFSHMMNVKGIGRMATVPTFAFAAVVPVAALKAIAIYFLLYGIIETGLAYFKLKKFETLAIAVGLILIASAEFIRWASFLYPTEGIILAVSLVIRVLGFITLFIPVIKFVSLGSRRI